MRMSGIAGTFLLCLLPFTAKAVHAAEDSAWIQMFNGKDLNDWDFKIRFQTLNVDPKHTFKVKDGNLFVDYSEYKSFGKESEGKSEFGHMAYKPRKFSYYLLRSEYQFTGTQAVDGPGWAKENNGFMLHSQSMASMTLNQDFPNSLEAQLLGGNKTMNLCTPGTKFRDMSGKEIVDHCPSYAGATQNPPKPPAWTYVSALVYGDSLIKFMVGKDTVWRFTKPMLDNGTPLKEGYIAIQGESAPVLFRKIEILDLVGCMDKTKVGAYRSYFVKHDAAACATSGVKTAPEARDFSVAREGGALRLHGEGAYLEDVRRPDGARAAGFVPGSRTSQFIPREPGIYLVSVKTATGSAQRKVPLY
jgi:hypothetical protein